MTMRIERRTFARFLGFPSAPSVELPSGDIQDLDIPDAAWGVEIFSVYSTRNPTKKGLNSLLGDVSAQCEKRRFIFGSETIIQEDQPPIAVMCYGHEKLLPNDIFIPVHRKPKTS